MADYLNGTQKSFLALRACHLPPHLPQPPALSAPPSPHQDQEARILSACFFPPYSHTWTLTQTDISSDSRLQAELIPTTDPESPPSLDLTGGAEWTTEDYLENTQVWELSMTWNQTLKLCGEATEEATVMSLVIIWKSPSRQRRPAPPQKVTRSPQRSFKMRQILHWLWLWLC